MPLEFEKYLAKKQDLIDNFDYRTGSSVNVTRVGIFKFGLNLDRSVHARPYKIVAKFRP